MKSVRPDPILVLVMWVGCLGAFGDTVCLEAELANEVTYPFEIVRSEEGSDGLVLGIAEGAGCGYSFDENAGIAHYRTVLAEDGTYSVWLRAWWNGNCSSSIFIKIGDAHARNVESKTFRRWHWVWAADWQLKKGPIEIQLRNREDGVRVDQILLSSAKLDLPSGAMKSSVTPGVAGKERPEPRLHLGALTGVRDLPSTDFRLSHSGIGVMTQDSFRTVVLTAGTKTPLTLWFRNNALKDARGTVEIHTEAPIDITPFSSQPFHVAQGVPLTTLTFTLLAREHVPRGRYRMVVRVRHDNGKLEATRLDVTIPFQWLVTNAMTCPKGSGIETRSAVEGSAGIGFPGTVPGVTWRAAPENAVTPFGLLDMRKAVADRTYVMAYAYTRVSCAEAGEYLLDVRHDDMIRIWLNGTDVFTGVRSIPSDSTRKLIRVNLVKGDNELLVKICQVKNYWEFGVGVLTMKRAPAAVFGRDVAQLLPKKELP